jgi:hypothetical protein
VYFEYMDCEEDDGVDFDDPKAGNSSAAGGFGGVA